MIQLIKKGGLRERANRSSNYKGSENTETTLKPVRYQDRQKIDQHNSTQTKPFNSSISDQDQ